MSSTSNITASGQGAFAYGTIIDRLTICDYDIKKLYKNNIFQEELLKFYNENKEK